MEPPRLEDHELFLKAALDHQEDSGVERERYLRASRAARAVVDESGDTTHLTNLLEDIDARLDLSRSDTSHLSDLLQAIDARLDLSRSDTSHLSDLLQAIDAKLDLGRSNTTHLTRLLGDVDTKLNKLLASRGPEDLSVPEGPVAVRVMMSAIRKEFYELHQDVERLQQTVDLLSHALATEARPPPE